MHVIASAALSTSILSDQNWIALLVGVIIGFLARGKFG